MTKLKTSPIRQLDLFERPTPKQLWLMNFKNPLTDRLGKGFFKALPTQPGVYKMKNERGEILYVGKAKNLKARLKSYTHVNVENSSRKVLRLVHLLRSIEWETLGTEKEALLRENELLRNLRPEFNVMNTTPFTYLFAHLDLDPRGIRIHFAMEKDPGYAHAYGAFKGLGTCYRAHKALLRLMWMSFHDCRNGFELPSVLTSHRKLSHYTFPFAEKVPAESQAALFKNLKRLFNGTSKTLLDDLIEKLLSREDLAGFTRELIQADLETVLNFYERCAKRNQRIKRELKLESSLIDQDKLDDFLVLAKGLGGV